MRDNFLHFLTLNQAIQDGGTGSNPASIIFRTRHRLKPYAGDDAPSGLRPCGGGMRRRAHAPRWVISRRWCRLMRRITPRRVETLRWMMSHRWRDIGMPDYVEFIYCVGGIA